jgi:hypothetical protein
MTRKQIILISILTLSLQNLQAQIRTRLKDNDWKRNSLNSKVHKVEYREYEPFQNSDSSFSFKLNFEAFINSHYDLIFNKKGHLSRKDEYFAKKDSLVIADKWTYKYDEKYRISEEQKIAYKYPDTATWNYAFPDENIVLIEKTSSRNEKIFYRYIQDGEREELATRRSETPFKRSAVLYYDKNNRIYKNESYVNDTIYSLTIYNYLNSKSNNISTEKYIYKGETFSFGSNQYDKKDNIIFIYNEEKKIRQSFEYVYDQENNWIERKTFNAEGKFIKLAKRKIIYY